MRNSRCDSLFFFCPVNKEIIYLLPGLKHADCNWWCFKPPDMFYTCPRCSQPLGPGIAYLGYCCHYYWGEEKSLVWRGRLLLSTPAASKLLAAPRVACSITAKVSRDWICCDFYRKPIWGLSGTILIRHFDAELQLSQSKQHAQFFLIFQKNSQSKSICSIHISSATVLPNMLLLEQPRSTHTHTYLLAPALLFVINWDNCLNCFSTKYFKSLLYFRRITNHVRHSIRGMVFNMGCGMWDLLQAGIY